MADVKADADDSVGRVDECSLLRTNLPAEPQISVWN